jgi:hypothetical protein
VRYGSKAGKQVKILVLLGAAAILPYAVLALYYVSYRISCGLYQKGVETYDT